VKISASNTGTKVNTDVTVQVVTDVIGVPIIQVVGELDISNVDSFRAAIDSVITQNPERLVFDCSDLRFMDSSAISLFVQLSTEVCPVEIRNPVRTVRKIIEITGLADALHLDP
jgi:anti-anti-sigma factor